MPKCLARKVNNMESGWTNAIRQNKNKKSVIKRKRKLERQNKKKARRNK